jgi:hypothetical protein
MRLHCEACQAALRAEDVRFDLALAKCHLCGAVYDFASRQTRGIPTEAPRGLGPLRPRLYCQEARGPSPKQVFPGPAHLLASSYSLLGIDQQGRKVKLLSGIEDKDQVLYLEQALERRLGIEDSPVAGELASRVSVE